MGLILMYSAPLRFKVGKQNLYDILRLFLKLVRSRYCIYIPWGNLSFFFILPTFVFFFIMAVAADSDSFISQTSLLSLNDSLQSYSSSATSDDDPPANVKSPLLFHAPIDVEDSSEDYILLTSELQDAWRNGGRVSFPVAAPGTSFHLVIYSHLIWWFPF